MMYRSKVHHSKLLRWLKIFFLLPVLFFSGQSCKQEKKEVDKETVMPNIIFIMADDLGYGDLRCYGQEKIKTPNIDKLAGDGMRFTQAYAGSAVCAPSRSTLMTGFNTGKTFIRGNFNYNHERVSLPDSIVTVAEVLKEKGYKTGLFGKWGLAEPGSEGVPTKQGFDIFYGFLNQARAHFYCPDYAWHNDEKVLFPGNSGDSCQANVSEWYFEKMKDFVVSNKSKPFFAYFATQLPHAELRSTGKDLDQYLKSSGESLFEEKPFRGHGEYDSLAIPFATYAAMVSQLDRQVGELVKLLDEQGLAENTILFFTSDNGPHKEGGMDPEFFHSSGPLRGIKRALYEGGIRVPLIVRWTRKVAPGSVSDHIWAHWDLMPTALDLVGEQIPDYLDGKSVVPALMGRDMDTTRTLYWEMHENEKARDLKVAVRSGRWKAVLNSLYGNVELYNLDSDISETTDLAKVYPEKVREMRMIMQKEHRPSENWPVEEQLLSGNHK